MIRIKKKMSKDELKEHIIYWAADQLDDLKDLSIRLQNDQSIPDDELPWILGGIARQLKGLLELLLPIEHEEHKLVDWAQEFITTYDQEAKDYGYRSMN